MKHFNIRVFGSVQGVSFRFVAFEEAKKLGICGFVHNELNGTVYIEAEGDKKALEKFLQWCHDGPTFAKVEKVEVSEGEIRNYQEFSII